MVSVVFFDAQVNGKLNLSSIVPFDKPEYYHQRGRRPDQSFEESVLFVVLLV